MKRRINFFITPLVLMLLGSTGYSKLPNNSLPCKYSKRSAKELLAKSEIYCHHGRRKDGREILRYIEDYLPSSPEFPIAKLALADSFFFDPSHPYPEAILEYTNYLKLFPNSSKRDYVLYRIGLCHYDSIGKIERDQASTKNAIEALQRLLQEVPNSIYATDAKAKISICRHRLAETELKVGIYYVRTLKYEAAEKRLRYLLDTYSDCVNYERAYYFLAEALYKGAIKTAKSNPCHAKARSLEASIYYKKLIDQYPKGHLAITAGKQLTKINQSETKETMCNVVLNSN